MKILQRSNEDINDFLYVSKLMKDDESIIIFLEFEEKLDNEIINYLFMHLLIK